MDRAGFKWGIGSAQDIVEWQMGYEALSDYGYYQEYLKHYDQINGGATAFCVSMRHIKYMR
ncbi:MAG: hypothetical protein IJR13_05185 [Bacteroidales bacterium]|nr:hypothetical protein [Bacteroidales bacterium]